MIQKIVRVGNSVGIIIPEEILAQLGLRIGDEVNVELDKRRGKILIGSASRGS
ncbi:MAG: AbrB/MazE/SpoVT family DNA-binding domain-containing protein [bacterium]|nr:AbrB/MazE/SpoVT family DNA-binding domain-containing protein [bacterium]